MTDIVEFLRARLDEDEATARAVEPLGHNFDMGGNRQDEKIAAVRISYASEDGYPRSRGDRNATEHLQRHDPARVLREVEAKRHLLECAEDDLDAGGAEGNWAEIVIETLAAVYADHPDYRDEWR